MSDLADYMPVEPGLNVCHELGVPRHRRWLCDMPLERHIESLFLPLRIGYRVGSPRVGQLLLEITAIPVGKRNIVLKIRQDLSIKFRGSTLRSGGLPPAAGSWLGGAGGLQPESGGTRGRERVGKDE